MKPQMKNSKMRANPEKLVVRLTPKLQATHSLMMKKGIYPRYEIRYSS